MTVREAVQLAADHNGRITVSVDVGAHGFQGYVERQVMEYNDLTFTIDTRVKPIFYEDVRTWTLQLTVTGRRAYQTEGTPKVDEPEWLTDPNVLPFIQRAKETWNEWMWTQRLTHAIERDNARRELRLVLKGRGEEAPEPFPWEQ